MILGDKAIKRLITVDNVLELPEGLDPVINPASLNVRLGDTFLIVKKKRGGINLGDEVEYDRYKIPDGGSFRLKPGEFALATTIEILRIPSHISAYVQGRSSIGRIGLSVQNAGYVDPGFKGAITLELKNDTHNTINLKPGYQVAQIIFEECTTVERPYRGKYNGQIEATGSRMWMDK